MQTLVRNHPKESAVAVAAPAYNERLSVHPHLSKKCSF